MFVRRKDYENLVREAAGAPERERLVQLLVEQVEYLRLLVGQGTTATAIAGPAGLTFDDIPIEVKPWIGEEEEDLRAMRQANVISDEEFTAAMAEVRQREHIIE